MFITYDVALELVRSLRSVVETLRLHSSDVADQVQRAANSVVLNLAEGSRRRGGDKKRFFSFANGSATEVRGALDLADAWGWPIESTKSREILDRLLGLLWALNR